MVLYTMHIIAMGHGPIMANFVQKMMNTRHLVTAAAAAIALWPAGIWATTLASQPVTQILSYDDAYLGGGTTSTSTAPHYDDFHLVKGGLIDTITWWGNNLSGQFPTSFSASIVGARLSEVYGFTEDSPLVEPDFDNIYINQIGGVVSTPDYVRVDDVTIYRFTMSLQRPSFLQGNADYFVTINAIDGDFAWAASTSASGGPLDRQCQSFFGGNCDFGYFPDRSIADRVILGTPNLAWQLDGTVPATGSVPEPSTWAMMITGFGLTGAAARRRPRRPATSRRTFHPV